MRLVNAGLRMHVPSIVGSHDRDAGGSGGFSLIAEDGNPLPGVPRVQSEVFMAAGKTYDVMINVPAAGGDRPFRCIDRELSLSGNAIARDAGMLAYIGVNGAAAPERAGARRPRSPEPDTYNSVVAGPDAHRVGSVQGRDRQRHQRLRRYSCSTAPTHGTVTLNANGTFTYVPNAAATSDSFTYCANGTTSGTTCSSGLTATVTLGAATIEAASGIIVNNDHLHVDRGHLL